MEGGARRGRGSYPEDWTRGKGGGHLSARKTGASLVSMTFPISSRMALPSGPKGSISSAEGGGYRKNGNATIRERNWRNGSEQFRGGGEGVKGGGGEGIRGVVRGVRGGGRGGVRRML